jgi:hypothetical protein
MTQSNDRVLTSVQGVAGELAAVAIKRPVSAVVLSLQKPPFCPYEPSAISIDDVEFSVLPEFETVMGKQHYDVCIVCCHNGGEEPFLLDLRQSNVAKFYFVWMWDNHHHFMLNLRISMLADVVFPSHWHEHVYLNHPLAIFGPHMPAPSRQFSPQIVAAKYPEGLPQNRVDSLFGGFVRYEWLSERNEFIERMMSATPGHALSLRGGQLLDDYFRMPVEDRLDVWVRHKVHLVAPVARDMSSRAFEALITGQIPLVPTDVPDLDVVVPRDLQASLPILRYAPRSVESAKEAWREALARFDAGGVAGVAARHAFARDHHSLTARLRSFAAFVRRPSQVTLRRDGPLVVWGPAADSKA